MARSKAEIVADRILEEHSIQVQWRRTGEQIRELIVEAVELAEKMPEPTVTVYWDDEVFLGQVPREQAVSVVRRFAADYPQETLTIEENPS